MIKQSKISEFEFLEYLYDEIITIGNRESIERLILERLNFLYNLTNGLKK